MFLTEQTALRVIKVFREQRFITVCITGINLNSPPKSIFLTQEHRRVFYVFFFFSKYVQLQLFRVFALRVSHSRTRAFLTPLPLPPLCLILFMGRRAVAFWRCEKCGRFSIGRQNL